MKPKMIILYLFLLFPFLGMAQTIDMDQEDEMVKNELEGTWELVVVKEPTKVIKKAKANSVKTKTTPKQKVHKSKKNELPSETILQRDSTVKVNPDGSTETTITTVYKNNKKNVEKRNTPPQSEVMHKAEKPSIRFYGQSLAFSGFTGCNKMAGRYKLKGNHAIDLKESSPSTRMACLDIYNEEEFMTALQSVTHYRLIENKLEFLSSEKVVLVFNRK